MKKYGGFINISNIVDKVCAPIIKEIGPIKYNIWKNWQEIIGPELASHAKFSKLVYNQYNNLYTLYIETNNSSVATIVSYSQELIIERISNFLGFRVIEKLKILHK